MKILLITALILSAHVQCAFADDIPVLDNIVGIYNGQSTEKGWLGFPRVTACQVRISKKKMMISSMLACLITSLLHIPQKEI